ncbi:MAG: methyl-accepting chemotaxis protein, partial [Cyanobacteria bacterium J06558_2]
KIVEANTQESAGNLEAAIALYQEILELDRGGNYGDVAQQALNNLQQQESQVITDNNLEQPSSAWSKLSIKVKTSLLLIGVALTSSIGISAVAYNLADKTVTTASNTSEQAAAYNLTQTIAFFMRDRYGDIQVMADSPLFSDPQLRASSSIEQKQTLLDSYVKAYGLYNSIAAFDLDGNLIAQSSGKTLGNHKDRSYIQAALKTDQAFLSQPLWSKSSGIRALYLAAPIKDSQTGKTIAVMRARMPVEKLEDLVFAGKSKQAYLLDAQGNIFLASDAENYTEIMAANDQSIPLASRFDFAQQLNREWQRRRDSREMPSTGRQQTEIEAQSIFKGQQEFGYFTTFSEIEADFVQDLTDLGWSTVVTVDNDVALATKKQLLQVFFIGTLVLSLIIAALARLIAERATQPIVEAAETVGKIGQGDLSARVTVRGNDELADLSRNINKMTGQIEDLLFTQEAEAKQQRREKELLQQGVMGLLLDVEGAQQGDLTVRAQMTEGVVGSIADAFNATMRKLRGLLQEVQTVSSEVGQLSLAGEDSVRQLSESAINQTQEINQALGSIDEINQSVQTVANYAQEAAKIARSGSIQAKEGGVAMDATVDSIEKIRQTVADTSKKVKQLAESSQEIAQIVEIISGISEKTNLLAFNASVEAARAGEHGEGFRIVAEEVRRLADRITEATKEIQQLVSMIQTDTTSVLQGMETSTSEVVNGSELVNMTKFNLRSLAETTKQINAYLKYISTSTTDQTNTSQVVNQKISGIATVAQSNSTEAQQVVESLKTLVIEAENLQSSVSQFKLEVKS